MLSSRSLSTSLDSRSQPHRREVGAAMTNSNGHDRLHEKGLFRMFLVKYFASNSNHLTNVEMFASTEGKGMLCCVVCCNGGGIDGRGGRMEEEFGAVLSFSLLQVSELHLRGRGGGTASMPLQSRQGKRTMKRSWR